MELIEITEKEREEYNKLVPHPLQSFEWGEFRGKTGVKVIRTGIKENNKLSQAFTVTIHKIPHTPFSIGYFPKGVFPNDRQIKTLQQIAQKNNCIFLQLEPNSIVTEKEKQKKELNTLGLTSSFHPLFTKFSFILDITPTEEDLLKNMHSKTRYNIRLAERKGVYVEEDNSEKGFQDYMKLTNETTTRQKFYAHTPTYHKKLWETLPKDTDTNHLTYHLFHARFKNEKNEIQTLTSWILFVFKDSLYYPYGASSSSHRELMASNLMAFEAIRFGKKLGLKQFDMWGALGLEPDPQDPWYGFHKFKQGYGATLTEFVGSYDLVTKPTLYTGYKVADKLRWAFLRLKK